MRISFLLVIPWSVLLWSMDNTIEKSDDSDDILLDEIKMFPSKKDEEIPLQKIIIGKDVHGFSMLLKYQDEYELSQIEDYLRQLLQLTISENEKECFTEMHSLLLKHKTSCCIIF